MRTIPYSDILAGTLALAGIPLAGFDTSQPDFAMLRTFHDRRLRVAWEAHDWPDICRYEQRSFRAPWNTATGYAAGTEVLDIPTLSYLQALQFSQGQPPTIAGVVNQTYWAPCQSQYQADTYNPATAYTIGTQVLNPADNRFYQLFATTAAIGVAGAGVAPANGTYYPISVINGKLSYQTTATDYIIYWVDGLWLISDIFGVGTLYASASDTVTPDLATGWYSTDPSANPNPANNPPPTVTAVTVVPPITNAAAWGLLTPFQRYVAYLQTDGNGNALTPLGEVFAAYDRDPRITTKTCKLPFTVTSDGFNFWQLRHTLAFVWLYYRLQRPTLTGAPFDGTLVYASGQQIYFVNPVTLTGDFYNCLAPTTAGQSPATTAASWGIVALPYIFREYLVQGGYADWLTSDGQTDKAASAEGPAATLLETEIDKLCRQQQQTKRLDFRY